jgi:peptidyl-prolyl cis-trans isomerase D
MAASSDSRRQLFVRIFLGVVVLILAGSMLLYLVPNMPGTGEASTDTVAKVGDQKITTLEVSQQLDQIRQRNQIPRQLETLYATQLLKQMVFTKEVEYEAKQLGVSVSDQERAARIRQFLPQAFNGDTFVGMDQYSTEVQQRFQMPVPLFEELIRQELLKDKFQKLVTDGISVGQTEIQDEFRYRNQKIKLDYALIKPEDLQSKVTVDDAEIKAYYEKNKSTYQVPEKRVLRFGLIDVNQIRQNVQISDDQLKALYQQNIQDYQVPNRVHAEQIVLMTVGKTDAEVEEVRKKAEDILKQAQKKGANFEELAKKNSEDQTTKEKGGDLGWLTQGQTVPEFEKVAFSLPAGSVSDLVKTQVGFHIIKVLEKETAHTKPFDEVKESIKSPLMLTKADQQATDESDKVAVAIRNSGKISLDDLAKQFHLTVGETRPVTATEPVLELGNSPDAKAAIFRQRQGELSLPIHTDRGYVILQVKEILPAHQGSLEEVRDKVVTALKEQKASELAQQKAQDLDKRVKGGEKFEAAAKALGLEAKTSELFARNGSIPNVANGKQLSAAFTLKTGDVVPAPLSVGSNWLVYKIADKQEPNPADFDKQKAEITESLLQQKRNMAFDAFQTALDKRLKEEGKVAIWPQKLKGFGDLSTGT